MDEKIIFEFVEDYLEVNLQGEVSLKEYLDFFSYVENNDDLPRNLKVLGIDNGIKLKFSPMGVLQIAKSRQSVAEKFETVKHAFLIKDPIKTALAVLTTSVMNSKNYQSKIFSTKSAAIDWLNKV